MIHTAASHQGSVKMFWLQLWVPLQNGGRSDLQLWLLTTKIQPLHPWIQVNIDQISRICIHNIIHKLWTDNPKTKSLRPRPSPTFSGRCRRGLVKLGLQLWGPGAKTSQCTLINPCSLSSLSIVCQSEYPTCTYSSPHMATRGEQYLAYWLLVFRQLEMHPIR